MWTPLVGKGGMGGGAGGGRSGGGGGMMRTVQRSVVKDPFSHSSSTASNTSRHAYKRGKKHSDVVSVSSPTASSPFPSFNRTVSSDSEGFEWECVDGSEFERGFDFYDDFVFGSVPSKDEAQFAVSSLLQALNPASSSKSIEDRLAYESDKDVPDEAARPTVMVKRVSSVGTELDSIEPSLQLCSPRMLQPYGSNSVYDAFHLFQTEPCIQRMVASLSTDKAVWDAVLKNEVVQELRESLSQAAESSVTDAGDGGSHDSDAATNILSWIFDNTKAKVTELIQKITNLVNVLFQPREDEQATTGDTNAFNTKLRASIFLTIVVFFIVVGDRCHK